MSIIRGKLWPQVELHTKTIRVGKSIQQKDTITVTLKEFLEVTAPDKQILEECLQAAVIRKQQLEVKMKYLKLDLTKTEKEIELFERLVKEGQAKGDK